ncbi:PIR Superfamily Protein [Plasmodium ovale wallikeri]|uniref:PIR Superfamily Protein n=1 Tax=Plasmodium ovale wallikeri TaxID=864142 RepID=A0A1A9AN98_PLAOA|nr:PIR Superfamily Protein [Plasmodium ovale wallikeri]SBT59023.1 PIR Superfamily Protein [Plasmodium ovale wallikeri]
MVKPIMCTRSGQFENNKLPSNLFLKKLNENNYSEELYNKIESYKSNNDTAQIISKINEQFEKIIYGINHSFSDDGDEIKCCRDINYYIDLVNAIVKSTNILPNDIQDYLISHVEQKWNEVPKVKHIDECKGKVDLDSIRKRCILKQLYDLVEDKNFIRGFPDEYEKYLIEKWSKIIAYTNIFYGNLYIKIENDSMGIIGPYSDILNSTDYICDAGSRKLSLDDITISTDIDSLIGTISLDNISSNITRGACYNKTYIDMLKKKTSDIQRVNNHLSIGIALLGFTLILIFLYKFSPLGSLLRRFAKKKIEIDENMSEEEMSELYDNSENERQYISYNSVSQ